MQGIAYDDGKSKADSAIQQPRTITGIVTSSSGEPLPGVTVVIQGTTNGTITGADGSYSLANVSPAAILVFSFVGMEAQEIAVGERTVIDVMMVEETIGIEEVVVIGYGSIKKKDMTGAVVSVGNEYIVSMGTTSPVAALQGQVAGVNIAARTGLVGSDYNIEIRGVNSLSGALPLYVVDGIMTDNINFLNSSEIERIDILKDASSTAIYGSRGSNGVILVTTRTGSERQGAPAFSYSGSSGIRTIANIPDFLDYDESIRWINDRAITQELLQGRAVSAEDTLIGFKDYIYKDYLLSGKKTDWIGLMIKPALETSHYISASGGNENVNYLVGAGYQGDNGNITGQYFKKYSLKASIETHLADKWSMGANINLALTNRELIDEDMNAKIFEMPPWAKPYDENGDIIKLPYEAVSLNVSPLTFYKNKFNTRRYYLLSNFHLQFKPFNWMVMKTTFSPNLQVEREGTYRDPLSLRGGRTSQAEMSFSNYFSYIWDNQLSVFKNFGDHRVNGDFIYSVQFDRHEYLYGYGENTPFNSEFYNLGSAAIINTGSSFEQSTLLSFIGRANYNYKDKYLATGSVRWDGSSKLAEGNKWAYFPSAALAWRISQEDFLTNADFISNLKLRLSYGYTGNNNIPPYTTQFTADRQTYYDWNGTTANGFRPSSIANKELTWERTREWNLGIDYGFLGNRISGEINLYDKYSLNLLMRRKLAIPTGWSTMMDNIGSISNRGIEVQLRTINIQAGKFTWETNLTFSKNMNKIVDLYGKKEDDVANRWFIGQPVEVVYALVFDGIWQPEELDPEDVKNMEGTARMKDLNIDGVIDIDHDMKILGSPLPEWIGSFYTKFRYRNWDLSATFYTKQGVFIFSPFHKNHIDMNTKQILDIPYYMRENPVTRGRRSNKFPQPADMGPYYGEDAEYYGYPGFNKDASFVRWQNVALGYNFERNLLKKIGISSLRLYINVLNPYVWTDFEGYDPEWAGSKLDGLDANSTSFRIFQFGTSITF